MSGVIERINSTIDLSLEPRQVIEKREQTQAQKAMPKLAKSKSGKTALGSNKMQKLAA